MNILINFSSFEQHGKESCYFAQILDQLQNEFRKYKQDRNISHKFRLRLII